MNVLLKKASSDNDFHMLLIMICVEHYDNDFLCICMIVRRY